MFGTSRGSGSVQISRVSGSSGTAEKSLEDQLQTVDDDRLELVSWSSRP